jgi:hypothetical protein
MIEKGPNSPFWVDLHYRHHGAGGSYWIGVGLREDRTDDLSEVKYWFGGWYGHGDDGDWQPYHPEPIRGPYPADLVAGALDEKVHVCKVAADHEPPFSKDDNGVLDHDWDADIYISRSAEFEVEKPESDYW